MVAATEAQALAIAASVGAGWSFVWNAAAARRVTYRAMRLTFGLSAAFSAVFVVAWGLVAVYPDLDRQVWSEAITPFSLASFFVVWSGPPLLHFFHFSQPPSDKHGGTPENEVPPP